MTRTASCRTCTGPRGSSATSRPTPSATSSPARCGPAWSQDLPDLEEQFAAGEFAPLREWLREHVHRFGRRYLPTDLLERVAGGALDPGPYLAYLEAKLDASAQLMS